VSPINVHGIAVQGEPGVEAAGWPFNLEMLLVPKGPFEEMAADAFLEEVQKMVRLDGPASSPALESLRASLDGTCVSC